MPFKSDKQRGYLHAHPEITDKKGKPLARKWDQKYGGKVAKGGAHAAEKSVGWFKPLAVGIGGGALANQIPQNQRPSPLSKPHLPKKSKVKKYAYEDLVHSDDPEFNHQAARKAFDLVMKMDDDTAEMFTLLVAGEVYEDTVEKNMDTLQRHLNEVVFKRFTDVKQAMLRTVAKGHHDGAVEAAGAVRQIEEFIKYNQWDMGQNWEESDYRRDASSGRFTAKIKHTQSKPFSNRVAVGMGLAPTETPQRRKYAKLTPRQRAQYQDEYRQLASFLDTVTQSTGDGGDRNIHLRLSDKQGNEFRIPHTGGADYANDVLLNPNLKLVSVEASPSTLTMGGAAFGLAHALGAQPGARTGGRIAGGNRALDPENVRDFREDWTKAPSDMKGTNDRLYSRVGAAGSYVGTIAPPGSKAHMAAKMAEIVGSHGPEAEAVIGPSARKTAYRYRGTEKAPDRHIVEIYNRHVKHAKGAGATGEEEEVRLPRAGGKPGVETARRQPSRVQGGIKAPVAPTASQMARAREKAAGRPPTWAERANGRRAIQDQLRHNLPSGSLYNLQAESGNLPPSEGIMLNADGQIVSQAVGYGDDHYLPFNLKNLKSLKGGEYIRTRSVGGLTSEDIYTGLASGARRVTVVSRSGTFSVEFQPDLRGARRHGDKAKRMTRRYEQLLDAVQSSKVSSGPVPPAVERAIREEVAREYPGEGRTATKAKVKERIEEYRQDPDMGPEDEKIMNLVYEQGLADNPNRDANEWLKSARNMVLAGKTHNYQLDASGYQAAQDALQEQFPYYIKSHPVIEKEGETVSREKDRGYIEPGRNRPTGVKAGLFGTEANQPGGGAVGSLKFSASQADYQRGRIGAGPGDLTPREREARAQRPAGGELVPAPGAPPGTPANRQAGAPQAADRVRREMMAQDAAVELFSELQGENLGPNVRRTYGDVLDQDLPSFAASVQDPESRARFDEMTAAIRTHLDSPDNSRLQTAWRAYRRARGDVGAVEYDPRMALHWTPNPMEFPAVVGYRPNDTDAERNIAINAIDARTRSVTTGLSLSQLAAQGDDALRNELNALRRVNQELQLDPSLALPENADARRRVAQEAFGSTYDQAAINLITGSREGLTQRMEDVHRMRTLKAHYRGTWPGTTTTPAHQAQSVPARTPVPAHNPVGQAMSDVDKTRRVRNRLTALQRYREGLGDHEESPGDAALGDAQHLMELIDSGHMPDEDEVTQMLESTRDAFEVAPGAHSQLTPQQKALFYSQPGLFTQDEAGYWHHNQPTRTT